MEWEKLLSARRQGYTKAKNAQDLRTEFQRDYHRIITSASFRRLQDKTQVFPLDKSDFVRTRLTHSLEVSSLAKSLGHTCMTYIMENNMDASVNASVREDVSNILECAGLLHDIGNPPFGHFGEETIREWFKNNLCRVTVDGVSAEDILSQQMIFDLYNFEGNAQALRLLSKLHYLVDENGMHLTYAVLNTIIKYPVSSCGINKNSGNIKDKKMGYYFAEEDLFEDICAETGVGNSRYPLTFLLEAADDIAYKTADIEDSVKKGMITYNGLLDELKSERYVGRCRDDAEKAEYLKVVAWLEEKYGRALEKGIINPEFNAVQNWVISVQGFLLRCAVYGFTRNYKEIMTGEFGGEVLKASNGGAISFALSDIAYRYAFCSAPIYKLEIAAGTMLDCLLEKFVFAAVNFGNDEKMSAMDKKLMSVISDNYKQIYKIYSEGKDEAEKLYLRMLLVTDFICGMTDSYAKSLYQEFNAII